MQNYTSINFSKTRATRYSDRGNLVGMKETKPLNDNKTAKDITKAMFELEKAHIQISENLKMNPENKHVYEKSIAAILDAKNIIEKIKDHYGVAKYYPREQD